MFKEILYYIKGFFNPYDDEGFYNDTIRASKWVKKYNHNITNNIWFTRDIITNKLYINVNRFKLRDNKDLDRLRVRFRVSQDYFIIQNSLIKSLFGMADKTVNIIIENCPNLLTLEHLPSIEICQVLIRDLSLITEKNNYSVHQFLTPLTVEVKVDDGRICDYVNWLVNDAIYPEANLEWLYEMDYDQYGKVVHYIISNEVQLKTSISEDVKRIMEIDISRNHKL